MKSVTNSSLDAIAEVEEDLIKLLGDEDQFVRAEAVRTLARLNSPRTREALRELLVDPNIVVQEAAERALQTFAAGFSGGNEGNDFFQGYDSAEGVNR